MEGYSTEQETLTALRAWWDKNGKYVVAGLVIAALVIGGWRGWNYWQGKRASEAAGLYAAVVAAVRQNNDPAIVKAAEALIAAYPDTAYGALAGLAEARAQVEQQQLKAAETTLRRVAGNSPDQGLAAVANLRLARVQIQAGDAKGALATLHAAALPPSFAALAATVRGDAWSALGDRGKARQAYGGALAQASASSSQHALLQMRLASLPVGKGNAVAPTQTPAAASVRPAAATSAGGTAAAKAGTAVKVAHPASSGGK